MAQREKTPARPPRRCALVHDLSGVGRCALTVAIPTLAAMGIQPCPAPTAVLSTHTGGYTGMAAHDLSDYLEGCLTHWEELELAFDAVYTGYLCHERQQPALSRFFEAQRARGCGLVVVDPVLGDDGELYSKLSPRIVTAMRELAREADIITPNLTEAALLLDSHYAPGLLSEARVYELLTALTELAPCAVLTGVTGRGAPHTAAKRRGEAGYWKCEYCHVDADYPGTGDLFTSVLTGALLRGELLQAALELATGFVREAVGYTRNLATPPREGVALEALLPLLMGVGGDSAISWPKAIWVAA